jgi:hypothetical protein
MRGPIETIKNFCLIQLELLKVREQKLRKEIEDCHIQREFLSKTLKDLGSAGEIETDVIKNLLTITRGIKK